MDSAIRPRFTSKTPPWGGKEEGMSRKVPIDRPLSDEDRNYLLSRNEQGLIDRIDAEHGKAGDAAAGESVFDSEDDDKAYEEMTKAELDANIDARNTDSDRPVDKRISKSGTNAEKAARLRADDEWLDSLLED